MKQAIVTALILSLLPLPALAASNCLAYEPGVVTVTGTLRQKPASWILELDKPFCIEGRENDKTGMYSTIDRVLTLQLSSRKGGPDTRYPEFTDKPVVLVGTLHKVVDSVDKVAMMVSQIDAPEPEKQAKPEKK